MHRQAPERIMNQQGNKRHDLEHCFPFAVPVRRDDHAIICRNGPQPGHGQLPHNNENRHPPQCRHLHQYRTDKQFISQGVKKFAERSDHAFTAGNISVQKITERGKHKQRGCNPTPQGAREMHENNNGQGSTDAQQRNPVGPVQTLHLRPK